MAIGTQKEPADWPLPDVRLQLTARLGIPLHSKMPTIERALPIVMSTGALDTRLTHSAS